MCCNPAHLFLGTRTENNADRDQKGRTAKGSNNGRHTHPESTVRGEDSGAAKLTTKQVKEIRARYATGDISARELGAQYGISHTHVLFLHKRRSWWHINE
jgi:hypothetical protein